MTHIDQRLTCDTVALVDSWLNCPLEEQAGWLTHHRDHLTLQFLEQLKQQSDSRLHTDPQRADRITQGIMQAAALIADEPLAYPLAWWARGNGVVFHNPKEAVICYQNALIGYRPTGHALTIVRLATNLLAAAIDIDPPAAFTAYAEIQQWADQLQPSEHPYLLVSDQNYSVLLRRAGRYEEALVIQAKAHQLAKTDGRFDQLAEIEGNWALVLGSMGRFAECEKLLLNSRRLATNQGKQLTIARMEMNLGELYAILGRPADALRRLQVAHQIFGALGNVMEVASVALREATLLEQIGSLAQARRNYELSSLQFTQSEMYSQVAITQFYHAVTNRHLRDYHAAGTLLQASERFWQEQVHREWLATIHLEKVELALAQNKLDVATELLQSPLMDIANILHTPRLRAHDTLLRAELYARRWQETETTHDLSNAQYSYQQVLAYGIEQENRFLQRRALAGLGKVLWRSAPDQARGYLEQAVAIDSLIRADLSVQELKASFLQQTSDLLPQLVSWAIEQAEPEQALRYTWQAKGAALLDLLHRTQPSPTISADMGEDASVAALRTALATTRWQAAIDPTSPAMPQQALERNNPLIGQLEQKLWDARRQRNYGVMAASSTFVYDPSVVLAHMDADFLIEYLCCNEHLIAICVDRQGHCYTRQLAEVAVLRDLLRELNLSLKATLAAFGAHGRFNVNSMMAECQELLGEAYKLLIEPLGVLPYGAKLLIAPVTPLHKLPFAALWQGQHYLTEQHQIELIPTGALLATPTPSSTNGEPLIVAASAEGKLPGVADQARAIHQLFPQSLCLIDEPATLHPLRNRQKAPRFLHIAAHTIEREDAPIFTALQLAGEMLTVEQCYELPLVGTELVTLSSCSTNTGMDSAGSLLALQSAFFVAGARRVLSTLWEIHHEVAGQWMSHFYQQLAAGVSPQEALRQTHQQFLADDLLRHPAFWAAFVCNRRC